jgi:hypothetical protein
MASHEQVSEKSLSLRHDPRLGAPYVAHECPPAGRRQLLEGLGDEIDRHTKEHQLGVHGGLLHRERSMINGPSVHSRLGGAPLGVVSDHLQPGPDRLERQTHRASDQSGTQDRDLLQVQTVRYGFRM